MHFLESLKKMNSIAYLRGDFKDIPAGLGVGGDGYLLILLAGFALRIEGDGDVAIFAWRDAATGIVGDGAAAGGGAAADDEKDGFEDLAVRKVFLTK